jgi:pimeloyl-ACP methyl ester carboxylesterase
MAQQPFDPNEFAIWFMDGIKETVAYRVRQTFDRQKIAEYIRSKIPTRSQVVHEVLKRTLEKNGFKFEALKLGDATFQLLRKQFREVPSGQAVRRLLVIPGFGDSPASWMGTFSFARREVMKNFDEVLVVDFPGYLGFSSAQAMVPSMAVLQGMVRTVCEANPPTVLVGHSLGGWLAAKVAQELRRPFDQLILISPSGLIPENERDSFGDLIMGTKDMAMDDLVQKVIHSPKRFHKMLSEDLNQFFSKPAIREFVESVNAQQFVNPMIPFGCSKISVIWGESDEFVPASWLRYWVENFGETLNAYSLKQTGHLPHIEHPKVLAEVLVNAMTGKPATTGSGWKLVHQRKREQTFHGRLQDFSSQKLLS